MYKTYTFLNLALCSLLFLFSCNDKENDTSYSLDLGEDRQILDNESIVLDAGAEGVSYKWSTGDTGQSIKVDTAGKFWVEVHYPNSEVKSDTIVIDIAWRMANITTQYGNILLWLYPQTPLHKEAFLELVNQEYFNGQTFNRVINDFVIQGGCPDLPDGSTDTAYYVDAEFHSDIKHFPGALGGGRNENPLKKTQSCQFYIVDKSAPHLYYLNMRYTIFGHVVEGLDLVDSISNVATNAEDKPLENIVMSIEQLNYTKEELFEQYGFEI